MLRTGKTTSFSLAFASVGLLALGISVLLSFSFASAATVTLASQHVFGPTNGLIGYWSMNGPDWSDKVHDRSVTGNNAYFIGGATSSAKVMGKLGQGLFLDGVNDYLFTTHNYGDATTLTTLSLALWFKTSTPSGHKLIGLESTQTGVASAEYDRDLYIGTDGKLYFRIYDGASKYASSSGTYADGKWHHVVATVSGNNTTIKLYVDGILKDAASIGTIAPYASASYWRIGAYTLLGAMNGSDGYFLGTLDDIRIYNRALSATEVRQLSTSGQATIRTDLLTHTTPLRPFTCGVSTVKDADANTYNTVLIGTQCWMAQNLRVGTRISGATNQTNNATIEKWCYSNLDASCTSNNPNVPDGGLYQWDEAMQYSTTPGAKGICPAGWHIPTHNEFTTLERAICTSGTCATDFPYDTTTTGYRGTTEGTKLKSGGSSGFEGNLAGYGYSGSFSFRGSFGAWWSSSQSGGSAWYRNLFSGNTQVGRDAAVKAIGFSVRCLKDS